MVNKTPAYFVTSTNLRDIWIANIIYEVQVNIDDVHNFKPSGECQEIRFFTIDDAAKEQLFPNIKEFLKQYNPANH
ncbi:MAG: hypothetical protein WCG25_09405 [bacterium]